MPIIFFVILFVQLSSAFGAAEDDDEIAIAKNLVEQGMRLIHEEDNLIGGMDLIQDAAIDHDYPPAQVIVGIGHYWKNRYVQAIEFLSDALEQQHLLSYDDLVETRKYLHLAWEGYFCDIPKCQYPSQDGHFPG